MQLSCQIKKSLRLQGLSIITKLVISNFLETYCLKDALIHWRIKVSKKLETYLLGFLEIRNYRLICSFDILLYKDANEIPNLFAATFFPFTDNPVSWSTANIAFLSVSLNNSSKD